MLKKPITFEDFEGNERTEIHYFNINKGELAKMELTLGEGKGYVDALKKIAASGDPKLIIETFENFIAASYGQRSEDGQHFYKNDEIFARFKATPAYDAILLEMCTDASAAAVFVNGVVPVSIQQSEEELQRKLQMSAEELAAELERTPAQLARERSERQMQGHQPKHASTPEPQRVADPIVQPVPVPTHPQFQAPQPAFTPQELTDRIRASQPTPVYGGVEQAAGVSAYDPRRPAQIETEPQGPYPSGGGIPGLPAPEEQYQSFTD